MKPFVGASQNGRLDMVNRLLQDPRVDPSAQDNKAILEASRNGFIGVVNRLLQDSRVHPSVKITKPFNGPISLYTSMLLLSFLRMIVLLTSLGASRGVFLEQFIVSNLTSIQMVHSALILFERSIKMR